MRIRFACWFAAAWLVSPAAFAEVDVVVNADGTKYTEVLFNGPSVDKYDIVFVGDGFRDSEQDLFNARVQDAVEALETMVPYSERMCGFNIWRVNVISEESGVDHPADDIFRNSELDCRYGDPDDGEAERCVTSDSPAKCFEAAGHAPDADAVFVLVNDAQWGGCAGDLVFSSIAPGFAGIITHELGHKVGLLADEYTCYVCDGSDDDASYTGGEPAAANATTRTALADIKWNDLIDGGTPLPTTVDDPPGVVGLWEGAVYAAQDVYRPQSDCHMRSTGDPFCEVCEREMRNEVGAHCHKCEVFPLACLDLSEFVACRPPCRILRWPFEPGCLSCPDFGLTDDIVYILEGPGEGWTLNVLDDHGRVIAQGRRSERGLEVAFRADRSEAYLFELKGPGDSRQAQTFRARLLRNGKAEALPKGAAAGVGR